MYNNRLHSTMTKRLMQNYIKRTVPIFKNTSKEPSPFYRFAVVRFLLYLSGR